MTTAEPTLALAIDLLARPSITPEDGGCQHIIGQRLAPLGFRLELMPHNGVQNLWARWGDDEPLFAFAGHTDVVPPGPLASWHSLPFAPEVRAGKLYGRGAADMKGSLAAMVVAIENFLRQHPNPKGSIALLLTSDEEGPAIDGTRHVIEQLEARREKIRWCLVGEPSCQRRLGDTIKNGRRGSLHGELTLHGIQGHVAYPHRVNNPIHLLSRVAARLSHEHWDSGDAFFPPTSLQISNIQGGTGATNVVPASATLWFNLRFSPALTVADIQGRIGEIVDTELLNEEVRSGHKARYDLTWNLSGEPFITEPGELVAATSQAIAAVCGITPELSTGGGTSDGRFIAPTGAQVLEFGPVGTTIHQVDEHIDVLELEQLASVYQGILTHLLVDSLG